MLPESIIPSIYSFELCVSSSPASQNQVLSALLILLDWPKRSFRFFCKILWGNPNKLFGPPNTCINRLFIQTTQAQCQFTGHPTMLTSGIPNSQKTCWFPWLNPVSPKWYSNTCLDYHRGKWAEGLKELYNSYFLKMFWLLLYLNFLLMFLALTFFSPFLNMLIFSFHSHRNKT